jgi:hypothetical protein
VLIRAAVGALFLALALTACAARSADSCLRTLNGVDAVTTTIGDQQFVHFTDGSLVGVDLRRTPDEAALLAPAANGPGDPFAYVAVSRAIVSWRGTASDPHLLAVASCLR